MQQGIIDRLGKTREQIHAFRERTVEELTQRADETLSEARDRLKAGRAALDEQRERLVCRADEAIKEGQGALLTMQATVLESTRDALAWAGTQLGPKAEFVHRGERALTEALVALRAGHTATLPLAQFDTLSVKAVIDQLDAGTLDAQDLRTLRAYEGANKGRKTLLRELDKRVAMLAPTATA